MAVPEADVWLVDLGPVLCQAGANPAMVKRNLRETGVNVYNHVERAAGVPRINLEPTAGRFRDLRCNEGPLMGAHRRGFLHARRTA